MIGEEFLKVLDCHPDGLGCRSNKDMPRSFLKALSLFAIVGAVIKLRFTSDLEFVESRRSKPLAFMDTIDQRRYRRALDSRAPFPNTTSSGPGTIPTVLLHRYEPGNCVSMSSDGEALTSYHSV